MGEYDMDSDRAPSWSTDPGAVEFDLIIAYYMTVVAACLATTTASALDDAVVRFVAPVNSAFASAADPEQAAETILWAAWNAVMRAAESSAGVTQARLVELVMKIRGQNVPARAGGRGDCRVWGLQVYGDLPMLSAQMREGWNWDVGRWGAVGPDAWANLNAFAARLTAAGEDYSLYALWTLRDCLEEDQAAHPAEFTAVEHWFTICGPLLASCAARGRSQPEWGAAARVGELCTQQGITEGGFSARRWDFWQSRLEAHAQQPNAAARAALAALRAAPAGRS